MNHRDTEVAEKKDYSIRAFIPVGNAGFPLVNHRIEPKGLCLHPGLEKECEYGLMREFGHEVVRKNQVCGNTLELVSSFSLEGSSHSFMQAHSMALRQMDDLVNVVALSDLRRLINCSPSISHGLFGTSHFTCVTVDETNNHFTHSINSPKVLCCKHVPEVHLISADKQLVLLDKIANIHSNLQSCSDPQTLIAFSMARVCFSIGLNNSVIAAARLNLFISALEALLINPSERKHIWDPDVIRRLSDLIGDVNCSKTTEMERVKNVRNDAAHRAGRDQAGNWSVDGKALTVVENWLRWAIFAKLK